jgi:hypothetical protein
VKRAGFLETRRFGRFSRSGYYCDRPAGTICLHGKHRYSIIPAADSTLPSLIQSLCWRSCSSLGRGSLSRFQIIEHQADQVPDFTKCGLSRWLSQFLTCSNTDQQCSGPRFPVRVRVRKNVQTVPPLVQSEKFCRMGSSIKPRDKRSVAAR